MTRGKFFNAVAAWISAALATKVVYGAPLTTEFKGREGLTWTPEQQIKPFTGPFSNSWSTSADEIISEFATELERHIKLSRMSPAPIRDSRSGAELQAGFDLNIGSIEAQSMTITDWRERYLKGGAAAVANLINARASKIGARSITTYRGDLPCVGIGGTGEFLVRGLWVRYVHIWDGYRDYFCTRFDVYYKLDA